MNAVTQLSVVVFESDSFFGVGQISSCNWYVKFILIQLDYMRLMTGVL